MSTPEEEKAWEEYAAIAHPGQLFYARERDLFYSGFREGKAYMGRVMTGVMDTVNHTHRSMLADEANASMRRERKLLEIIERVHKMAVEDDAATWDAHQDLIRLITKPKEPVTVDEVSSAIARVYEVREAAAQRFPQTEWTQPATITAFREAFIAGANWCAEQDNKPEETP